MSFFDAIPPTIVTLGSFFLLILKYNVKNDFIENDTIIANYDNLKIMLNDEKHAFGHGYCLAMALQEYDNLDK